MRGELLGIERDAHRHALHDLDPVAGRILRRQEREGRTGTGAEAGDRAVEEQARAVQVGGESHRLANPHALELRLLEVRIDPHLIERHDRHQRRPGAHALPELHVAPRHETGYRRRQLGARQGEVSVAHGGRGVAHLRMIGERRAIHAGAVGGELLLGGEQARLRSLDRIDRVLQFLARDRAGGSEALAAREIALRRAQVRLTLLHGGLELRAGGEEVAHIAHRARELRLRLVERHLRVGLIEAHQRLAGLYELGVIGAECHHRAGDLRGDLHHVAADVRIVGGLVIAQNLRPVRAVDRSERQEAREGRSQPAPAPRGVGRCGVRRYFAVLRTHDDPLPSVVAAVADNA